MPTVEHQTVLSLVTVIERLPGGTGLESVDLDAHLRGRHGEVEYVPATVELDLVLVFDLYARGRRHGGERGLERATGLGVAEGSPLEGAAKHTQAPASGPCEIVDQLPPCVDAEAVEVEAALDGAGDELWSDRPQVANRSDRVGDGDAAPPHGVDVSQVGAPVEDRPGRRRALLVRHDELDRCGWIDQAPEHGGCAVGCEGLRSRRQGGGEQRLLPGLSGAHRAVHGRV
jgi:hypothetical protein